MSAVPAAGEGARPPAARTPGPTCAGAPCPGWWPTWPAAWPTPRRWSTATRRCTCAELAERGRRASPGPSWPPGWRKGDRVAIWAPNCAEWVVAALGSLGAGAVLVTLNTRFKGGEAAYILRASGATPLCTVRASWAPTTRPSWPARTWARWPGWWCCAARECPGGHRRRRPRPRPGRGSTGDRAGRGSWPAVAAVGGRGPGPRRLGRAGRRLGPHLHLGDHRAPKGAVATHAQSLRTFGTWALDRRAGRGRPLPDRQPVLPHLRLQGRAAGLLHDRGHHGPRAGLRRGRRAGPHRRRAHHRAARPPRPSTSRSWPTPTAPRTTSPRCGWG